MTPVYCDGLSCPLLADSICLFILWLLHNHPVIGLPICTLTKKLASDIVPLNPPCHIAGSILGLTKGSVSEISSFISICYNVIFSSLSLPSFLFSKRTPREECNFIHILSPPNCLLISPCR